MKTYASQQVVILMLLAMMVGTIVTAAGMVAFSSDKTSVGACYRNIIEPDIHAKILHRIQFKDEMRVYYTATAVSERNRLNPNEPEYNMDRTEEQFLARYSKVKCEEYNITVIKAETNILQHQILQMKLRGDR